MLLGCGSLLKDYLNAKFSSGPGVDYIRQINIERLVGKYFLKKLLESTFVLITNAI